MSFFADAIASELPQLRAQAESLMTLTLRAYAPGGETIVDGFKVEGYTFKGEVYGKVQGGSSSTKDPADRYISIGGVQRPILYGGLHLPLDAPVPVAGEQGIGWEYEVTSVGDLDDQSLFGRRYLVYSSPAKSFATARRLDVVEV